MEPDAAPLIPDDRLPLGTLVPGAGGTRPAPRHPARREPREGSVIEIREAALERLWDMLRIGSVVGSEQPFLTHLRGIADEAGLRTRRTDGVLEIVSDDHDGGPVLCAHVDRHGLVALDDGSFGYAAHVVKDDSTEESTHATRAFLTKVADRFDGEEMFAYDPTTGRRYGRAVADPLTPRRPGTLTVNVEDLPEVPPGTPVGYTGPTRKQRTGETISAQLDNALPVAIAIELLVRGIATRAFFTREEEIGHSADHVLRHLAKEKRWPQLLVLDTSPFPTTRAADVGAVVLRTRDAGSEFDEELAAELLVTCDELGIEYVLKDAWIQAQNEERVARGESELGLGRTELGRIIAQTDRKVRGATIQIPTWDYHSSAETTTVRAVDSFVRLLVGFLQLPD